LGRFGRCETLMCDNPVSCHCRLKIRTLDLKIDKEKLVKIKVEFELEPSCQNRSHISVFATLRIHSITSVKQKLSNLESLGKIQIPKLHPCSNRSKLLPLCHAYCSRTSLVGVPPYPSIFCHPMLSSKAQLALTELSNLAGERRSGSWSVAVSLIIHQF
jgi:hypothetical protein